MQPILAESAPHRRGLAFAVVLAVVAWFAIAPTHHHRGKFRGHGYHHLPRIGKCVTM
jgi:hypothetical protein